MVASKAPAEIPSSVAAAALVWEVVDEKPCMLGMRCVVLCRCCEYLCCGKFAMPRVTVTSWKYDNCTDSRISKCKSYAGVTLKKNMICQHNNILAIITKFDDLENSVKLFNCGSFVLNSILSIGGQYV